MNPDSFSHLMREPLAEYEIDLHDAFSIPLKGLDKDEFLRRRAVRAALCSRGVRKYRRRLFGVLLKELDRDNRWEITLNGVLAITQHLDIKSVNRNWLLRMGLSDTGRTAKDNKPPDIDTIVDSELVSDWYIAFEHMMSEGERLKEQIRGQYLDD